MDKSNLTQVIILFCNVKVFPPFNLAETFVCFGRDIAVMVYNKIAVVYGQQPFWKWKECCGVLDAAMVLENFFVQWKEEWSVWYTEMVISMTKNT